MLDPTLTFTSVAGFDIAGFDIAGFDIAGFDIAGFDIAGFDIAGFEIAGGDIAGGDDGLPFTALQPTGCARSVLYTCRLPCRS